MPSNSSGALQRERRAELRIAVNHTPAELSIIDGSAIATIPGVIVNLSRSGLKVMSDKRTAPGQQVKIKAEKLIIFGEVRHCRAVGKSFETGVKVSDVLSPRGASRRLTEEQIRLFAVGRTGPGSIAEPSGVRSTWHIEDPVLRRAETAAQPLLRAGRRFQTGWSTL